MKDLTKNLSRLEPANVVSHSNYSCKMLHLRGRVYGRRPRPELSGASGNVSSMCIGKHGSRGRHFRVNACSDASHRGKYLAFQSSNTIRAGKRSHADAYLCTLRFNHWLRRSLQIHHEWHTALSSPNMVMTGTLRCPVPPSFRSHWRSNWSDKFPGVAVETNSSTTPEVYPRSGKFIVPGVCSVPTLEVAIKSIVDACQT